MLHVRRESHHGDGVDLRRDGMRSVNHVPGITNNGVRKNPSNVFNQISAM